MTASKLSFKNLNNVIRWQETENINQISFLQIIFIFKQQNLNKMGFRYHKRIGTNKGLGLNISGSGLSSSYRSKYGSIGSKGFSIKSGIPGLTFRSGWGGGKNKGAGALVVLAVMATFFFVYISIVVLYNLIRLLIWGGTELYHLGLRLYYRWKEKQALKLEMQHAETNKNIS
ncbi:hypothetical protein VB264_07470 [Arcicella aquatica]|uniref:DUF4236 domain-containing protein n=1 Tax=Arcicella aquatica TaxID=217141 RepID=A0ABU5QKN4_9BACT|nr:hypothetical protein [Arcicella aquatica]MEA5257617.1 hypothetical protein [Arcicella aquatica]